MPRLALLFVALLSAAALGVGVWRYETRPPPPTEWQGYAEADFVKVGPTQQGLLIQVLVARGDLVSAGQPLFAQDDTQDRAARDQVARQLDQSEEQLANLESSGRQTEIDQASANLVDARATLQRTKSDLDRDESLLRSGNVTIQNLDQRRADYRSALAKVAGLEAALAQARAPIGRAAEIKGQGAAVEAARAALAMAEWRLAQRRVSAPVAAIVADVLARPGETVTAGAPVVSLLPPANLFVRFFVPEPMLSTIHHGDSLALICDRCPADLTATVSFIAPQAEYTPPVIYSESSRGKLVYMIEARPPPDRASLLNPGQPIVVRPLAHAGRP